MYVCVWSQLQPQKLTFQKRFCTNRVHGSRTCTKHGVSTVALLSLRVCHTNNSSQNSQRSFPVPVKSQRNQAPCEKQCHSAFSFEVETRPTLCMTLVHCSVVQHNTRRMFCTHGAQSATVCPANPGSRSSITMGFQGENFNRDNSIVSERQVCSCEAPNSETVFVGGQGLHYDALCHATEPGLERPWRTTLRVCVRVCVCVCVSGKTPWILRGYICCWSGSGAEFKGPRRWVNLEFAEP